LTNIRNAWQGARDDGAERRRRFNRGAATGRHNGARDGAGLALFPQHGNDGRKIALGGPRHDVGSARTGTPHAHIERAFTPKRKPALGLIELHRGDAEVEHDAVDGLKAEVAGDRIKSRESRLDEGEAARRVLDQIGAEGERALIAVKPDDPGRRRVENRARMSTGPEGRVDVDAAVPGAE
jgi:hypothetical protein